MKGFRVNLLLVPASYPHPGAEWAGAFNERSAIALRDIVDHLQVLSPTPYAPRFLSFNARWKAHLLAPKNQVRNGIRVHRPAYPRIPGCLQAFWPTTAAYLFSRRVASRLHKDVGFDALLSFDLASAGGLAWRLGRYLGVPACGWATGSDMRRDVNHGIGRSVRKTLQNLDVVFYQSQELRELAARLLDTNPEALSNERHIVQARGVKGPSTWPSAGVRQSVRAALGLCDLHTVVLYVGRISRQKGLFGLVEGFTRVGLTRPQLALVLVGSRPGQDETAELTRQIGSNSGLSNHVRIVPGCSPEKIWDYLSAADIFAFPSFEEGMPNSLIEALLAGLPCVAFGIPCVREILQSGRALIDVTPYDFSEFWHALLTLVSDPALQRKIGERGRAIANERFSIEQNMRAVVDRVSRLTTTG